jgi:PAS domain S-box-containing protein
MSLPDAPMVKSRDLGLIHLKSQALVNLFFGIPMVTLVLPFWGLPLSATFRITAIYLLVYAGYFVPLWLVLPRLLLRPVQPILTQLQQGQMPNDLQLKKLIEFLLNYPLRSSARQYLLIISGFTIGSVIIPLGAIPEIVPVAPLAVIYVLVVGLVVSVIEAFLNFTFLENYMVGAVTAILNTRPILAVEQFESRRISLLGKIMFIVLGTVIASQLIILVLIIGKLALAMPGSVAETVIYLGAFMLLTGGYVVLAVVLFTRNISSPLHRLISWSGQVSGGQRTSLTLVTNDEISDVALYANRMVASLGNLTAWLEQERDQLTTEKDKLSAVLSRVDDGVIATDAQGKIVLFNQAMEELTGWSEAEAIGRPIDQVVVLYRDSGRAYPLLSMLTDKDPDSPARKASLRLVNKHQANKYVNLSTAAIGQAVTTQVGRILTFHDVSQERELERMKIDFVSMAAHELRTPLTSLKGYLDILNKELSGRVSREQMLFLHRSLLGANQLTALIENLLNVSRIERGALKIDPVPISLPKVVGNVVRNLNGLAKHSHITIKVVKPKKDDRLVMADHFRIAEVITNLIANAIAYSPAGSQITVTIGLHPHQQALVTIADQGHGIPPEAQAHLFTKFYRVAGNLSQGSKGTGLGLYISKAIVDAHHGKIWVDSTVGKGSTFSFTLPLAPVGAIETIPGQAPAMIKKVKGGGSTNQLV